MSRLPSLNCVQGQVSSSLSLHSVSVRPPDYEPGLASLTLRCSTRGESHGEIRVVHGGEDIYGAVKEAVKSLEPDKEIETGEDPVGYWAISVGNSLVDKEIRNKFCLSLLGHITARSFDVVTSCTVTSDTDNIEEVLTWLVKKQVAAVTTDIADTCAVVITSDDVTVLGQGGANVFVVNNVVKEAVEKLVVKEAVEKLVGFKEKLDDGEGKRKGKFSESGYGSEDDKKDSSNEMINKIEEESDEILDIKSLSGGKSPCMLEQIETELKASFENLLSSNAENESNSKDKLEDDVESSKEESPKVIDTKDVAVVDKADMEVDKSVESNDIPKSEPEQNTGKESHTKDDETVHASSPIESKVQPEPAFKVAISPIKQSTKSPISPLKSSPQKAPTDCGSSPKKLLVDSSTSPKKSSVGKSRSLIAAMLGGSPSSPHISKYRETHDDPLCPSSFSISPPGPVDMSRLVIKLCHGMFCRQWKFVTSCRLGGHGTTLYFRHDPRILPGLGQQSLCGLVWRGEALGEEGAGAGLEVHNGSDAVGNSVKETIVKMMKAEVAVKTEGRVTALDLTDCEMQLFETPRLFNDLLQIMIKNGFNLYATVETEFKVNQMNVLMFRQSTVSNISSLTLSLERGNVLVLYGGEEADVVVVRETLASRWPYPVVQDARLGEEAWVWKVRRYPWRISYGSKFVDRAVLRASKMVRQLSQDRLRQLPIPPPSNSDMESAKSLVIFLIKELSEKGWKFVGTNQVSTKMQHSCFLHFLK